MEILIAVKPRSLMNWLVDGKTILKVEIPAKNLKDVLSQLRAIGRVEEKSMPADGGKRDINVIIEIKN